MSNYKQYATMVLEAPVHVEKKPFFIPLTKNHKLALAIIEPREHPFLAGILRQFVNIYQDHPSVSLTVIHGKKNKEFVNAIVPWGNVQLVELDVDDLTLDEYSDLCCSTMLWDLFLNASHVLVFQTDTWIFKQVPDIYFSFAYTGAPWNHIPFGTIGKVGGNGGLSLRRVETMRSICRNFSRNEGEPEDVFFSRVISPTDICPYELAKAFSVEAVWYPTPVGFHKAYKLLSEAEFASLVSQN
jgi:hypothetical protein